MANEDPFGEMPIEYKGINGPKYSIRKFDDPDRLEQNRLDLEDDHPFTVLGDEVEVSPLRPIVDAETDTVDSPARPDTLGTRTDEEDSLASGKITWSNPTLMNATGKYVKGREDVLGK